MSTVYNRVGTAMVPEEARRMSMDTMKSEFGNQVFSSNLVMDSANTRCVGNIMKKNSELTREIYSKVCELARFVTATEGENGHEPEINYLLDDLEVQNVIMCRTIVQLDSLIDAMYIN